MGPGTLHDLLAGLSVKWDPNLLVGFETADDAGVYRLDDQTALIQTVDFFTPMVDDPYWFGQIAAANALSDVYAMGGRPMTAMNIVAYPTCGDLSVLREILRGGLDKIQEAGAVLVGGHTVDDNEPKYGLSVTGVVRPDSVIANRGVQPGDAIYLSKPLGTGVIATAIKAEMAEPEVVETATRSMAALNRGAMEIMTRVPTHAATDVTGFGLLGHLMEMAEASEVTITLQHSAVPMLPGSLDCARMGLIPGGTYSNRDYLASRVIHAGQVDRAVLDILYTPETSGGLLIAVPAGVASDLEELARLADVKLTLVATASRRREMSIEVE